METIAPPREGTTGAHLVAVGQDYLVVIQGPESRWLAARVLEYLEALQAQVEENGQQSG